MQSNVTQRVKALEAEIGTALFERHSRGMTLTGAGRRLLPYAQRMAALSREALLAARDDGEPKGPLAIGSMETTAAVRLPSLLAEFHRRFPGGAVEPADLDDGGAGGWRAQRHVGRRVRRRSDRSCRTRLDGRVPGRTRAGHGAAMVKPRRFACGYTGIRANRAGVSHRMHLRQRLEQVFTEFGWPSSARFELGTLDGMIGCVAADMGVTLLPRAVVGRNEPWASTR